MIIVRLMVDKEESCLRKKYVLLIMIIYGYDFSAASRLTFFIERGLIRTYIGTYIFGQMLVQLQVFQIWLLL